MRWFADGQDRWWQNINVSDIYHIWVAYLAANDDAINEIQVKSNTNFSKNTQGCSKYEHEGGKLE
ncbi:hypothetical protein [Paenibacillus aceti]|uniref:Uncharacterized protein n=1 Tax=Paenibacillus aceti TaxID=1820010 RepID=A0ABQ1W7A5_9BACL|nr:hypothetical protein [Paenibacillus aceti]GGG16230.1 hypothetical protein GCM10010913_42830 [Paenibacillus aceti]